MNNIAILNKLKKFKKKQQQNKTIDKKPRQILIRKNYKLIILLYKFSCKGELIYFSILIARVELS